jgi:hypothetical protein
VSNATSHRCRRRKEDFYRTVKMTTSQGVAAKRQADDETSSLIHTRELSSSSETSSLLDSDDDGSLPISYGVYRPAGADQEAERRRARDGQQKDALSPPNQSDSATIRQVVLVLLIGEPTCHSIAWIELAACVQLATDRGKVSSPLTPTGLSCSRHIRSSRQSSTFWATRVGSSSASRWLVLALSRW